MQEETENPVLDYGDDAVEKPIEDVVEKPADAALGYGDNAVDNRAVKSDKGPPKAPTQQAKELIIIGNGYAKYDNVSNEIKAIKEDKHYPQNEEMNLTAKDIGTNIHKITDAKGFFKVLERQKGPFNKVIWIGHGSELELLPSMPIPPTGGRGQKKTITSKDFNEVSDKVRQGIVAKLTPDAKIFLISCTFSQDENFKQTVANFFQRCVNSFKEQVRWCIMFSKSGNKIKRSGRLALDSDYYDYIKNLPLGQEDLPVCTDETLWKKGLDIFEKNETKIKQTCPTPP